MSKSQASPANGKSTESTAAAQTATNELSADDLALLSAVLLVTGDLFGLLSVLKARSENNS